MSADPAPEPAPPVADEPSAPSNLDSWAVAIAAARNPRIKSAEMIAALDAQWEREGQSARAAALCNDGFFCAEHLRRIVALEVARDTLIRVASAFPGLQFKTKKFILGE